jgi:hemerythrin-like metal-binding protein
VNTDTDQSQQILPWHPDFATGIENIDSQHQVLLEILNRLAVHLAKQAPETLLLQTFKELEAYTHYHFDTEEQLWAQAFPDDPEQLAHQSEHRRFIRKLGFMQHKRQTRPQQDQVPEMVAFLFQWLVTHILDGDLHLARFYLALQQGLGPAEARTQADREMAQSQSHVMHILIGMYTKLSSPALHLLVSGLPSTEAAPSIPQSRTTASTGQQPSTGGLADLPGIDLATGLRVCNNDQRLYLKLLRLFHQQQRHFEREFETALAAEALTTAERLAHSLKGVAGNIGALELKETAAQLEQACRQKEDCSLLLHVLLDELNPVLEGISALLEAAPNPAEPSARTCEPVPDGPLRQLLLELQQRLISDDYLAIDSLHPLTQRVTGQVTLTQRTWSG